MKKEKKTMNIFEKAISYEEAKMYFDEGILPVCIVTDSVVDRIKQDQKRKNNKESREFTYIIDNYYDVSDNIKNDDIGIYRVLNSQKLRSDVLSRKIELKNYIFEDNEIRYIFGFDENDLDVVLGIVDLTLPKIRDKDFNYINLDITGCEVAKNYSNKKMFDMANEKTKVKKKGSLSNSVCRHKIIDKMS